MYSISLILAAGGDASLKQFLPIMLIGMFIMGMLWLGIQEIESRSNTVSDFERLDDYELESMKSKREQLLEKPTLERVWESVGAAAMHLANRFSLGGYITGLKEKLNVAGYIQATDVDRFMAVRLITLVLALVFLVFGLNLFGFLTVAFVVAALVLLPEAWLNRKVKERQVSLRNSLPDMLDLLTISVEAGLGFEQALQRAVEQIPGPLAEEFKRFLAETRTGSSRADALRALDRRTGVDEIRSFVLAILQADTFGVSIARVLRVQAEEMRIKRRQMAQEKAQKAPVKMLFPMVFCIFPAVFVVVLGPAVINIQENFK